MTVSAAKWIAVHGNVGISDTEIPVALSHGDKGVTATPVTKQSTSVVGVIHFPIPSAPSGDVLGKKLNVVLETTMANVTHVAIYYGRSEVYTNKGTKSENDLKSLDISKMSASTVKDGDIGYGICVTLEIKFEADDDQNQSVAFSSVGMLFS